MSNKVILERDDLVNRRYRVVSCLSVGGMGAVYEAIDERTNRVRAVKVMLAQIAQDPDMRARFEREATIAARVESEHVVPITDAGIDPDLQVPFLVMDRVRGVDLAALSQSEGPMAPSRALTLVWQLARGLSALHAEGIVHRDIKPSNVLVTQRDDGSCWLKVIDLGIAKSALGGVTVHTTRSLGTPAFMAPEQMMGDPWIDHRADIYALGHLAFCLLVGRSYWEALGEPLTTHSLYARIQREDLPPPSSVAARDGVALPPSFDGWWQLSCSFDPSERFETVLDQVSSLEEVFGGQAAVSESKGIQSRARKLVISSVVAVVLVGLTSFAILTQVTPSEHSVQRLSRTAVWDVRSLLPTQRDSGVFPHPTPHPPAAARVPASSVSVERSTPAFPSGSREDSEYDPLDVL